MFAKRIIIMQENKTTLEECFVLCSFVGTHLEAHANASSFIIYYLLHVFEYTNWKKKKNSSMASAKRYWKKTEQNEEVEQTKGVENICEYATVW